MKNNCRLKDLLATRNYVIKSVTAIRQKRNRQDLGPEFTAPQRYVSNHYKRCHRRLNKHYQWTFNRKRFTGQFYTKTAGKLYERAMELARPSSALYIGDSE